MTDRELILKAAEQVGAGTPLRRFAHDTIYIGGRCAQFARETTEGALALPANTWEVALAAHDARKARRGTDRWATDYEAAVHTLGLARPAGAPPQPGDLLYWPYRAKDGNDYGHTALYLGDGLILENSDINAARALQLGSTQPLGKGTQVFVTPLARHGTPRTVAIPTQAIRAAETPPAIITAPAPRLLLVPKGGGRPAPWDGKPALYGGVLLSAALIEQLRTIYPLPGGPWTYQGVKLWQRQNGDLVLERL